MCRAPAPCFASMTCSVSRSPRAAARRSLSPGLSPPTATSAPPSVSSPLAVAPAPTSARTTAASVASCSGVRPCAASGTVVSDASGTLASRCRRRREQARRLWTPVRPMPGASRRAAAHLAVQRIRVRAGHQQLLGLCVRRGAWRAMRHAPQSVDAQLARALYMSLTVHARLRVAFADGDSPRRSATQRRRRAAACRHQIMPSGLPPPRAVAWRPPPVCAAAPGGRGSGRDAGAQGAGGTKSVAEARSCGSDTGSPSRLWPPCAARRGHGGGGQARRRLRRARAAAPRPRVGAAGAGWHEQLPAPRDSCACASGNCGRAVPCARHGSTNGSAAPHTCTGKLAPAQQGDCAR